MIPILHYRQYSTHEELDRYVQGGGVVARAFSEVQEVAGGGEEVALNFSVATT